MSTQYAEPKFTWKEGLPGALEFPHTSASLVSRSFLPALPEACSPFHVSTVDALAGPCLHTHLSVCHLLELIFQSKLLRPQQSH